VEEEPVISACISALEWLNRMYPEPILAQISRMPSRIASEKPPPRAISCNSLPYRSNTQYNLRREAAPHATAVYQHRESHSRLFQSQTRSRSTCDVDVAVLALLIARTFNLRREAAPHATEQLHPYRIAFLALSISDEKPLHMRLLQSSCLKKNTPSFQSQTRSRSTCDPQ
jgi:hypothetical protein